MENRVYFLFLDGVFIDEIRRCPWHQQTKTVIIINHAYVYRIAFLFCLFFHMIKMKQQSSLFGNRKINKINRKIEYSSKVII